MDPAAPEQHGDTLWTIGHSTRAWEDFVALLRENAIACLVDVRRFAGSRRNPQFSPVDMAAALEMAGIEYLPMPAFGGRRKADEDSPNGAWRVAAFRGYADYMATPEFALARERLVRQARAQRTSVMCAEAVWWRCHRRLIADDFTARGWTVQHIMAPGKLQQHLLNPDARLTGDHLVYPPAGAAQEKLF
jgi:uncharacterized protein (DUF488 family)